MYTGSARRALSSGASSQTSSISRSEDTTWLADSTSRANSARSRRPGRSTRAAPTTSSGPRIRNSTPAPSRSDRPTRADSAAYVGPQQTESARRHLPYARRNLARYKCPTSIEWRDSLPRNPTGKLLKKELRAHYWAGSDRQVH